EFLVLDGVFEDEHGAFPAGSYVRNPPTSRHTPGSTPGCVLFVKLWQFDPADRTEVRANTAEMTYETNANRPEVQWMTLFRDDCEEVRLERWMPDTTITRNMPGGAELAGAGRPVRRGWRALRASVLVAAADRQRAAGQGGPAGLPHMAQGWPSPLLTVQ